VIALIGVLASDVNYAPFTPAKTAPVEVAVNDHEAIRLRPGLGYLGWSHAPLGTGDSVFVPAVGLRYWFRQSVGFELGIGGNVRFGSGSMVAVGARASLPIAAYVDKHVTIFVAPLIAFTQANQTIAGSRQISPITGLEQTPPDTKHAGTSFSGGLRLGAEVHLGFIGVQRLSLIGAIGLEGRYSRLKTSAPGPSTTREPVPVAAESRATHVQVGLTADAGVVYYF
jgi:hypothetical protein